MKWKTYNDDLDQLEFAGEVGFDGQDAFVPARHADEYARGIALARKKLYPGSHMLPDEHPADIVMAVANGG